jgi:hypothetical protein
MKTAKQLLKVVLKRFNDTIDQSAYYEPILRPQVFNWGSSDIYFATYYYDEYSPKAEIGRVKKLLYKTKGRKLYKVANRLYNNVRKYE